MNNIKPEIWQHIISTVNLLEGWCLIEITNTFIPIWQGYGLSGWYLEREFIPNQWQHKKPPDLFWLFQPEGVDDWSFFTPIGQYLKQQRGQGLIKFDYDNLVYRFNHQIPKPDWLHPWHMEKYLKYSGEWQKWVDWLYYYETYFETGAITNITKIKKFEHEINTFKL